MNPVLFALVTLFMVGFGVLVFIIFVSISASAKWQFSRIEKGNVVFVAKGEDLKTIIPNVDGHLITVGKDLDGYRWLVKIDTSKSAEEQKREMRKAFNYRLMFGTRWLQWILWDRLGVRFVSWLFPQIRIKEVHISMNRLKEEERAAGAERRASTVAGSTTSLRERIEFDEGDIDSLRYVIPRPMVIEGVELAGDNSRIDLLVLVIYKLVIPSLPIFYYKGRFMSLLDAAVSAGIINFFTKTKTTVKIKDKETGKESESEELLTYKSWLSFPKGPGSPLEVYLRGLNATRQYYDKLQKAADDDPGEKGPIFKHLKHLVGNIFEDKSGEAEKPSEEIGAKISSGLIPTFGLFLESIKIIDWRADDKTIDMADAVRLKETNMRLADAAVEKAKGERLSIDEKSQAEAERFKRMFDALCKTGANPDEALRTLRNILQAEELKSIPNLQTLVLGHTDTALMVNK